MPGPLANLIRQKYPGAYDDMDDATLENSVLSKYPEYADLTEEPKEIQPVAPQSQARQPLNLSSNPLSYDPNDYAEEVINSKIPEPDTYWGGFKKGLGDYFKEITSGVMPALETAANPQTPGDFLGLLTAGTLPNIPALRASKVSNVVGDIVPKASPVKELPTLSRAEVNLPPEFAAVDEIIPANTQVGKPARTAEEKLYDLAREKFNMGRDLPAEQFDPKTLGFDDSAVKMNTEVPISRNPDPNKPVFRLDPQSGAGIPLDKLGGKQTGPAVMPGKELAPELAKLSKYNQAAKFANESQKKSMWSEVRDANRALLTSFDFSAGRQGKPLIMTKAYWTSLDDMFKSWGSQRAYDNVMESIDELPVFKKDSTGSSLAERGGLNIGGKEETFKSNFAENWIPGVKRSERAYSAFLNKLRADHFNTMVNDARGMGLDPDKNDIVLKQIGTFINDATGRGSFGKLEKAAPIFNEVFFAPRLMASRVNMYKRWLNPKTYSNENPVVRKQAIKSLLSTVGFGLAVGELAREAGAKINNDPRSSDFRKIKIGDRVRIDPFSGFQQYAVGASRLLSGETTSSKTNKTYDLTSGKFGQPTRASVASQFFQNKLAPIPSFVWSWMEGRDWDGEPFEAKKALLDRTVPIIMQDLKELYDEDPNLLPLGILPLMGEGLQTYGR